MLQSLIAVINPRITVTRMAHPGADSSLRPLSPRSIVLSVLLGTHPPAMRAAPLVEFTSLFGISEGSLRTALSRMAAAGELTVDDGVYRLSGRLLDRQREQDTGRHGPPPAWDGTWWIAAVHADRRSVGERRFFRAAAVAARFGELRPDTWMRPANIDVAVDLPDTIVTRGPLVHGDPQELVGRLWDLDSLARTAQAHLDRLGPTGASLDRGQHDAALADAFMTLAAAQRFLRTEPQLPDELAVSRGAADLRARYDEVATAFQRRLAAFLQRRAAPIARRATQ